MTMEGKKKRLTYKENYEHTWKKIVKWINQNKTEEEDGEKKWKTLP